MQHIALGWTWIGGKKSSKGIIGEISGISVGTIDQIIVSYNVKLSDIGYKRECLRFQEI